MKKVLFLSHRFHINQYEWIKILLNRKFEVRCYVLYKSKTEKHDILKPNSVALTNLFSKILEFRPDVVIVKSPFSLFGFCGFLFSMRWTPIFGQGKKFITL